MFKRKRKYRRTPQVDFIRRAVRSIMAIVILSTLVLGVSYFVKEVSDLDPKKIAKATQPVLSRLGISEEQAGAVAGKFVQRVTDTELPLDPKGALDTKTSTKKETETTEDTSVQVNPNSSRETSSISTRRAETDKEVLEQKLPVVRVAIMSDSESNFDNLGQALTQAKNLGVTHVFFIGDYSELGVLEDLEEAKYIMDSSGIDYDSIPGDRDLWQSVGPENFVEVFGETFHKVKVGDTTFIMLDNSANYTPIASADFNRFLTEVSSADFVLLATPLYHPSNDRVMGVVKEEVLEELVEQRELLLEAIRESDVKAVFGAEHHFYSEAVDPIDSNLLHIVNGALASSRNLQTPRFSVLNVFDDSTFDVEQVVLK